MADWAKLFDGEVAVKAPLGLADLMAIPGKRGVFLLEGPDQVPLLLATAADIRARLRFRLAPPAGQVQLSKRVDLRELAVRLRWKLSGSPLGADLAYLELARAIYPDTYNELLSFQPAWYVCLDLREPMPFFQATREAVLGPVTCLGPFPRRAAATRFVEVLEDAFDLCRHEQILRRYPHGSACVYGQMGRCQLVCTGKVPLDAYLTRLREVHEYAVGDRAAHAQWLSGQMKLLAGRQEYEQANRCKSRLARLAELAGEDYHLARPIEQFQYILMQRGPAPNRVKIFWVDRGAVESATLGPLPVGPEQWAAAAEKMATLAAQPCELETAQRERLSLVTDYLVSGPERAPLAIRYRPGLSGADLEAALEQSAQRLKVKLKPERKPKAKAADKPTPGPADQPGRPPIP